MLLTIANRIPFLQVIFSYSFKYHKAALKKFLVLWAMSILPMLLTSLVVLIQGSSGFWGSLQNSLKSTDMFIYSASFLPPMIYLFYERYHELLDYINAGKRSPSALSPVPKGFELMILISCTVFLLTTFFFGLAKAWEVSSPNNALAAFKTFANKAVFWVYLYSIFCWYLTILMASNIDSFDFVSCARQQEENLQVGFAERMKNKGGSNG
jgi:hypothetical protein